MLSSDALLGDLFDTITAFISAKTWDESQQIVEQHPELLRPETDAVMQAIAHAQEDEQLQHSVEFHRALLARCRAVGIPTAFAELTRRNNPIPEGSDGRNASSGFEADLAETQRLEQLRQRDPRAIGPLIQLYEHLLDQLCSDESPVLRAALQHNLGAAYAALPTENRNTNLRGAIACYEEALRVYTPAAAPLDYAMTQNNLGNAYASLPTGDRSANLRGAIACYEEALRVYTPAAAPLDYAMTQNNLGAAYASLPTGDREANLWHAIACYQEALRFRTLEAAPFDYAMTQSNLGNAYRELPSGDPSANLRQAIACYQDALRVWTLDIAPFDYAGTQNNKGLAYASLPTGDRDANLRGAIACYEEALRVYTSETAPFDYVMTQNNLGNAYRNLPSGNRDANLRRAIACYEEALRVYTPETAPSDYAMTQNNLGNAYHGLLSGDRSANLQQAIACYQDALRFLKPNIAPREYAMTQHNLGNGYRDLPSGDRSANLRQAIACYQEALRVYTLDVAPFDYAMTQNNLGNAYAALPTGSRDANLRRAIACYQEALRVYTPEAAPSDYAMTQNNLGNAYRNLPTRERSANLKQAITCYQEALRFRTFEAAPFDYAGTQNNLGNAYRELPDGDRAANLRQAIAYYQETLCIWTLEAMPRNYAMAQNNLGLAYADLSSGDRDANLHQAIACYQEALHVYTPTAAPAECRTTNRNLADLYFTHGKWREALEAYHTGIDAGERLYRAGLSAASKASEVSGNIGLYRKAAFAHARLGDPAEALLTLERGKTRLLADVLRLGIPRPVGVPDTVWPAFEAAGRAVRSALADNTALSEQPRDPVQAYETQVQGAQTASAALDAAIEQVRAFTPGFLQPLDLDTVRSVLPDSRTALVAVCLTDQGSLGLVLRNVPDEPVQLVELPSVTDHTLRTLIAGPADEPTQGSWVGAYLSRDAARWRTTMDHVLAAVGMQVLGPVLAVLPSEIEQLILLPSGDLFLLPLHAAPLPENGAPRVCDRYQVRYAPSAEVLIDCQVKASQRTGQDLFAVINPVEDPKLAFTPAEGAAIARLFDTPQVVVGRAGTKEAVRAGVKDHAYVHLSCHGAYNWNDPPESGLELANGERFTLAELQRNTVDLSVARVITLSACETGISDVFQGSAEEYVGLPAGFLLAGVPCVVSSLWSVPDISTAMLMERFYRNHLQGNMDFAAALGEAQLWVRSVRSTEAADYAERCYQQAQAAYKAFALRFRNYYRQIARQDPTRKSFAHPYYWAAFTVNGI